jgi:hypothetical protein
MISYFLIEDDTKRILSNLVINKQLVLSLPIILYKDYTKFSADMIRTPRVSTMITVSINELDLPMSFDLDNYEYSKNISIDQIKYVSKISIDAYHQISIIKRYNPSSMIKFK